MFAYVGLLGIILQGGLIGRLVARLGERRLIAIGFACAAVSFFALGFTYPVWLLLVVASVSSFGTGVLRPALTSLITQQVGRHEQGTVLGLNQSLMSVAQIVGPAVGGLLIDVGWLAPWAVLIATVCVVPLVLRSQRASRAVASAG